MEEGKAPIPPFGDELLIQCATVGRDGDYQPQQLNTRYSSKQASKLNIHPSKVLKNTHKLPPFRLIVSPS